MRRILIAATALIAAAGPVSIAGQSADSTRTTSAHLFTRRDLYYAGGFAAATLALAPLDRAFAEHLQDSTVQANDFLDHGAVAVRLLGSPGSILIATTAFALGRATGDHDVADVGLHTAESILLAEVVSRGIKGVAGRARPELDTSDPYNFRLGAGIGDTEHQSFPSGHTTAAFAAASAFTAELGLREPRHRVLFGSLLYGGATLVGLSRMYNNRHWASDVAVGAAIGTFSGWKVVGYTHAHPHNPVDRWLLRTSAVPMPGGGVMLTWSAPAP
jgi:membrane-associated phospholipid phosphatase